MQNLIVLALMGFIVNWAPILLLIGVWVFYTRKGWLSQFGYLEKLLQEQKRHNEVLEKILARLDRQP